MPIAILNYIIVLVIFVSLCRDLKQLSAIEPKLSAAANCAALYIQCQLLLAKVRQTLIILINFVNYNFFYTHIYGYICIL